jgi:hypothetical protein
MPEPANTSLPPSLDAALQKYVDDGCPGDVNHFLDALGIEHQPVQSGEFEPRAVVCEDGYKAVQKCYYNKHDGEQCFWTCVPNLLTPAIRLGRWESYDGQPGAAMGDCTL